MPDLSSDVLHWTSTNASAFGYSINANCRSRIHSIFVADDLDLGRKDMQRRSGLKCSKASLLDLTMAIVSSSLLTGSTKPQRLPSALITEFYPKA